MAKIPEKPHAPMHHRPMPMPSPMEDSGAVDMLHSKLELLMEQLDEMKANSLQAEVARQKESTAMEARLKEQHQDTEQRLRETEQRLEQRLTPQSSPRAHGLASPQHNFMQTPAPQQAPSQQYQQAPHGVDQQYEQLFAQAQEMMARNAASGTPPPSFV